MLSLPARTGGAGLETDGGLEPVPEAAGSPGAGLVGAGAGVGADAAGVGVGEEAGPGSSTAVTTACGCGRLPGCPPRCDGRGSPVSGCSAVGINSSRWVL